MSTRATKALLSGRDASRRGRYVSYEQPEELKRLNSTFNSKTVSVFPKNIYKNDVVASERLPCASTSSYILGVDRHTHPNHASSFGYINMANHIHAYGYNDVHGYETVDPPGMAPERFYTSGECKPADWRRK